MRLERLAHASLVIETDEVCCLMDPVFVEPLASGTAHFDPPMTFDVSRAREQCNVIVLSHHHPDHFCIPTLAQLDRQAIVYYPQGSTYIEGALGRLGFTQARALVPGSDDVHLADLRLVPTQSRVPFAEMGMVFEHGGRTLWNLVDTFVDEAVIGLVRRVVGRIDALVAAYQPLDQMLARGPLGHSFPHASYGEMLKVVFDIRPRAVIPGACGVRYLGDPWLDERGFPMTARQFLADVARVDPEIAGLQVPAGASVEIGERLRVDERGATMARAAEVREPRHDWRPDRGVQPLVDRDPMGYGAEAVHTRVASFLEDELLAQVELLGGPAWRSRMARLGAMWRLEVVYPGGARETRLCDLGAARLAWSDNDEAAFAKVHTTVAASAIVGFLAGDYHPDRLLLGDARTALRLYAPHRGGVEVAEGVADDPLLRVLNHGALERYYDKQLRALGC
jgi:L-ascorbate metabolism protein UlaG (beta-lactamase superfamily)